MVKKVTRTEGPDNLLQSIFDWKFETDATQAKLMLTILARTQKPSFAVTVNDDATIWTVYLTEASFRAIDNAANFGPSVSPAI